MVLQNEPKHDAKFKCMPKILRLKNSLQFARTHCTKNNVWDGTMVLWISFTPEGMISFVTDFVRIEFKYDWFFSMKQLSRQKSLFAV